MEQHAMKRIFFSVLVLGVSGGAAFAHPGDHLFTAMGSLAHLLTEPDHLAMMAGAALLAIVVWRMRKSTKA